TNQITEQQLKKMHEEVKEMHSKYTALTNDVKNLKDSQAGIQENMNAVNSNFDKLNGNIEEIMNKLNVISEDQKKSTMGKIMGDRDGLFTKAVKKPLRKLAIGTISTIMTISDYSMEKASSAKEGMEDIVAEASYNNKKRRNKMCESVPS
ncbi:MAG TPA: hypothetical protein VM577_13515, partial [Anaerovoracaceae bacterium]|nr:hypothetical protein [Anaerovoracaceae bacterium]